MALTHFSWANDLDPKGASGARRHIKEVIDPTTSLSLLPAQTSHQDAAHQPSASTEQGNQGAPFSPPTLHLNLNLYTT